MISCILYLLAMLLRNTLQQHILWLALVVNINIPSNSIQNGCHNYIIPLKKIPLD